MKRRLRHETDKAADMVNLKELNNENNKDSSDGICCFGRDGRTRERVGGVPA